MLKTIIVLSIILSSNIIIKAQTVNTGNVVITSGTLFSTVANFNNTDTGSFINNGDVYVYHNWANDGVVDHDNNGITRFLGINEQIISGTTTNFFNDVLFDISTSFQIIALSNDISIANEATFNNGIVDNANFSGDFIFEKSAFHTNTNHDSFVNGVVTKIGDTSFNYPIGANGFYRFAEISAPSNVGDIFSGQYFFSNPDTDFPLANKENGIELINDKEYWVITRDAGTSTVLLTLSWDESITTPQPLVAAPTELIHIVRWDVAEQQWKDQGGLVDDINRTVTTPLLLDNYGVFTLARVKNTTDEIVVLNGVTPNNDGANDFFEITNIQDFPNNSVEIYNRWGARVFRTTNYDTVGNVFVGKSQNSLTIGNGLLPTATYYYIISYDVVDSLGATERKHKVGYLYLDTNE